MLFTLPSISFFLTGSSLLQLLRAPQPDRAVSHNEDTIHALASIERSHILKIPFMP